jgi:putative ABC transport system permease protein
MAFWSGFARDVRVASRMFRRHPAATLAALATLSLGFGASASVIALFSAIVFRSPFRDPGSLVRLYDTRRREDGSTSSVAVSARNFFEIRRSVPAFERVSAQIYRNFATPGALGKERVVGIGVSDGWLETLGVRPALGRAFSASEERQGGASRVAIVSDDFWRVRMGADRNLAGHPVDLDGSRFDVVGVLPPGFRYPYEAELWVPWTFARDDGRGHDLIVHARLAKGATRKAAGEELRSLATRLAADFPDTNAAFGFAAVPIADDQIETRGRLLLALAASVALLLALACANVASLALARAIARQRELAIRRALGASAIAGARMLAAENLLLTVSSGILGIGIAFFLCRFLGALLPDAAATAVAGVFPDPVAIGATLALAIIAGAGLTVVSLLAAPARSGGDAAIGGGRAATARTRRAFGALVVGEVALSLVLLTAAAILTENFLRVRRAELGFDDDRLLTAIAAVPADREFGPPERERLERRLVESLRALPGARWATAADHLPLYVTNTLATFVPEGAACDPRNSWIANHREVGEDYFRTLGIRLLRGRTFDARDGAGTLPVVVISRSMALRFWPGGDPIGRRVRRIRAGEPSVWKTIVGVVDDVREPRLAGGVLETWYIPVSQSVSRDRSFDSLQVLLAVRTDGPPARLATEVRRAVAGVDPGLSVFDVRTGAERRHDTFAPEATSARLLLFLGAFGLILASIGTSGILSYTVAQRRREIGIRAALGASPNLLLRRFLGFGARLVAAGLAAGLGGSLFLARYLARVVTDVPAGGLARLAAETLFLAVVGAAAAFFPARRASRVDPAIALRSE